MNAVILFGVLIMSFLSVRAQEIPILEGANPQVRLSLTEVARKVRPGQIIVMGELHGLKTAQQAQLELMTALRDQGLKVSAGLEFFYHPDQALVDDYRLGTLAEVDFLQKIHWGKPS